MSVSFEDVVRDIAGGVDLLWCWGLVGSRWWRRLFSHLAVLCYGDPDRPLAHVAMSLPDAADRIMQKLRYGGGPMNIVPVDETFEPRIVDSKPWRELVIPLRNEPWPRKIVVVGIEWLRGNLELLVPAIEKGRKWLWMGYLQRVPAALNVSADFRSVGVEEEGLGLVAECSLDCLVEDMKLIDKVANLDRPTHWNWSYPVHSDAISLVREKLEAFAVLFARSMGIMACPFWEWMLHRHRMGLGDLVREIAKREGVAAALERAVVELAMWSISLDRDGGLDGFWGR